MAGLERLVALVRELGLKRSSAWYDPHMAAAERAILDRVPLVDLVVEVRDARIPFTSTFEPLERVSVSHKHMFVLNKADLADCSLTRQWVEYFRKQNCICYENNSHNKENIKELLSNVRHRIKELKPGESDYTATVLLVGIPNVGKSALGNSLHQLGRIGAAEKGKLKHAIVSPLPGETKDISSYKIASHPNVYLLDTPGILSPRIADDESASKLALTGAIKDSLVGGDILARCFLHLVNASKEYKRWEHLKGELDREGKFLADSDTTQRKRRQYASDHTQDFIVKSVRQTLFKTRSSFKGDLINGNEMEKLIEDQFTALHEAFRLSTGTSNGGPKSVASKLLNLCRTGRLGRYTLDHVPSNPLEPTRKATDCLWIPPPAGYNNVNYNAGWSSY